MAKLLKTVESGDRAKSLEQLRDFLAARLEMAEDDRVIAPLAKQLAEVMRELEQIKPAQVTVVDDLQRQREKRRKAALSKRPASCQQRGSGSD